MSNTNVGVVHASANRSKVHPFINHTVATALRLKKGASIYFEIDANLDAGTQRDYRRVAYLFGGEHRGWLPQVLIYKMPSLVGLAVGKISATAIYRRM